MSQAYLLALTIFIATSSQAAIYKCVNEDTGVTKYNSSPITGNKCSRLDLVPSDEKPTSAAKKKEARKPYIKKKAEEPLPYPKIN